ncbi:hypothetical protein TD95_000550 [Thielaviopsis punctulata]|uniref:Microbial-type PARG catalytic domain-containing protein n=1 Tax=Thielaviopsis punctulata TaxID=72032 RepID=A0A0F4Z941_9PEZI|nr:hypothetical protein TD95_000550 [Thielaviopsis punctulata]
MDPPPRPNDVASQTKRQYLPLVLHQFRDLDPQFSYHFRVGDRTEPPRYTASQLIPPEFVVQHIDPVYAAAHYAASHGMSIPYLCPAHTKRPGGDWETGVSGAEEELCRRSSLSASLNAAASFYPLPGDGVVYSPHVVVFREPADRYAPMAMDAWFVVPVMSVAPVRLPKLNASGSSGSSGEALRYSFAEERAQSRQAMQAGLKAVLSQGYSAVVIGDFGLGRNGRNPPRVMAEMWRELFLYDPDIRGQFRTVVFAFASPDVSTEELIYEAAARAANKEASKERRRKGGAYAGSASRSHAQYEAAAGYGGMGSQRVTDFDIFQAMFHKAEIQRVLATKDPRYGLNMLTT